MSREENLLILKMLQEGTITVDQAAELLAALDRQGAPASAAAPAPPPPVSPPPADADTELGGSDLFARARAKIAAAREAAGGPAAASPAPDSPEPLVEAVKPPGAEEATKAEEKAITRPWDGLSDALKDLSDTLRGVDTGRIADQARRQARRALRTVRDSLEDLHLGGRGEPTLTLPREAVSPAAPGKTVRVRNPLGGIEALGADVPEVRVAGKLRVWAASEAQAQELAEQIALVVEEGDDGPTIRVTHPADLPRGATLDLKAFVPHAAAVSLLSHGGSVSVRDLRGGAAIATRSGDIAVGEVSGGIAAETASGSVSVEGALGEVTAASASGSVTLTRISGERLRAASQSGHVTVREATADNVELESVSGRVDAEAVAGTLLRIRTVSGDVRAVEISARADAHLDTVSGDVSLALRPPLTGGKVTLATVSGDARLDLPAQADAALSLSTRSGAVRARLNGPDGERVLAAEGMNTLTETLGAGTGAQISVSTVSGDVAVEQEA